MIPLKPSSRPGRVAAGCSAGFVLCFATMHVLVLAGHTGGDTFLDNPWLGLTGIAAAASALGALIAAVVALARGDRALVVWGALALGALLVVFVLGEALVPH